MRHRRFVTRLLDRPQLIAPAAGAAVVSALLPGYRLDGWDGDASQDARTPRDYAESDGTAIIPIVGEIVHRGGGMDALSGVTSYDALQDMVVDALSDPAVTGILLDIDSPGGEAGGNLDFAEWLAQQRGTKPIVAVVNSLACSAAYSIASAADTVLIGADAFAGSIGVVTYHADLSGALDKQGVVVTYTYAGDHKIDGNPTGPLTDQAQAQITGFVQTIYERFCAVVAANRGLSVDAVRSTQAAIFQGQAAVDVGLADAVATFGEALMATTPRTAPAGIGIRQSLPGPTFALIGGDPAGGGQQPAPVPGEPGAAPADQDPARQQPAPPASPVYTPADPAEVAEMCAAAGFPELTAAMIRGRASASAINARIAEAKEIKAIASSVNLPLLAATCVKAGMAVEDSRAFLFDAKANRDAGIRTDTTPPTERAAGALPPIDATAVFARMNGAAAGRRTRKAS